MRSFVARAVAALGILAVVAGVAPSAGALLEPPRATASLDVHQALAGTQQAFTVTVGQPAGGVLTPVRSVKIVAPAELFTIAAPTDPAGWTGTVSGGGTTLTYKASGGGIPGGSSQAFTFVADTLRPATDLARSWAVSTSTDAGTATRYTPVQAAAGALGTRVRTLEVLGVAVLEPAPLVGDPTLHVTRGQDAVVGVRVSNAGGAPQTVTTTLAGATATTSSAAPIEIAPGDDVVVPFDVAFGDALGHGKLVANATAGESVAAQRFLAYVALEPLELAVDPDNQTPKVVVPGRPVSFSQYLAVRGPDTAPALDLDPVASAYRFADGALVAPLGTAVHLAPGGGRWLPPTPPVTVPALADGEYAGVLHLEGTDAHGARFVADLPLRSGSLVVDSLAPIAELSLPIEAPLTHGDTVPLGGVVLDGGAACGTCAVTASRLDVLDGDGAVLEVLDAPVTLEADGSLHGGVPVETWPEGARLASWTASVADEAGLASTVTSHPVAVDIIAPAIVRASTSTAVDVEIVLTEWVSWPDVHAPATDWLCDGHTTTSAASSYEQIWLDLSPAPGPDEVLSCRYEPKAGRVHDRAGLTLADAAFLTTDRIAPLAPSVEAPAFTNTSTPTIAVGDLQPGNTVAVFEDGFLVGSGTAEGTSVDVTTDSLGANDRVVHLLVQVTDQAGNVGPATPVELTLDFTAPTLVGAVVHQDGGQVTVTFAEPLIGPDAVDDWSVAGPTPTGPRQPYTLGSADLEGAVVTLTVADPRFAPGTVLDEVGYEVLAADGSTRLTDRAGNLLPDARRSF